MAGKMVNNANSSHASGYRSIIIDGRYIPKPVVKINQNSSAQELMDDDIQVAYIWSSAESSFSITSGTDYKVVDNATWNQSMETISKYRLMDFLVPPVTETKVRCLEL